MLVEVIIIFWCLLTMWAFKSTFLFSYFLLFLFVFNFINCCLVLFYSCFSLLTLFNTLSLWHLAVFWRLFARVLWFLTVINACRGLGPARLIGSWVEILTIGINLFIWVYSVNSKLVWHSILIITSFALLIIFVCILLLRLVLISFYNLRTRFVFALLVLLKMLTWFFRVFRNFLSNYWWFLGGSLFGTWGCLLYNWLWESSFNAIFTGLCLLLRLSEALYLLLRRFLANLIQSSC